MISAVFLAVLALSPSFVSAAPVPAVNSTEGALATINAAMSLPNTTQTSNITWMYRESRSGQRPLFLVFPASMLILAPISQRTTLLEHAGS